MATDTKTKQAIISRNFVLIYHIVLFTSCKNRNIFFYNPLYIEDLYKIIDKITPLSDERTGFRDKTEKISPSWMNDETFRKRG